MWLCFSRRLPRGGDGQVGGREGGPPGAAATEALLRPISGDQKGGGPVILGAKKWGKSVEILECLGKLWRNSMLIHVFYVLY